MYRPFPLPWNKDTLTPFMSSDAITHHFDIHYYGAIRRLNRMLQKNPQLKSNTLVELGRLPTETVSNTACEILNHEFFMRCIGPNGGVPSGRLYAYISEQFGSYDNFVQIFSGMAGRLTVDGWVWLVYVPVDSSLMIISSDVTYNPITDGKIPLLALDMCRDLYNHDHGDDKTGYIEEFWNFANWSYIEQIMTEEIFGDQLTVY